MSSEEKETEWEGEGQEDAAITGARLARVEREKKKDNGFGQQHNSFIRGLTLSGRGEISEGTRWRRGGRHQAGRGVCVCVGAGGPEGVGVPTWRGREAQVRPSLVCLFAIRRWESRR